MMEKHPFPLKSIPWIRPLRPLKTESSRLVDLASPAPRQTQQLQGRSPSMDPSGTAEGLSFGGLETPQLPTKGHAPILIKSPQSTTSTILPNRGTSPQPILQPKSQNTKFPKYIFPKSQIPKTYFSKILKYKIPIISKHKSYNIFIVRFMG